MSRVPDPSGDHAFALHAADARDAVRFRAGLRAYLEALGRADSDFDAAEVIFGELIANVVDHAPGPVEFSIEWRDGTAVLHMRDFGSGDVRPRAAMPGPDELRGRGLFFVRTLGVETRLEPLPGRGTYARVVLPVHQAV